MRGSLFLLRSQEQRAVGGFATLIALAALRAAGGGTVIRPSVKGQRLVALFLLGFLLFNYPLLTLFAGPTRAWGIPLLYVYVFAVWAALIALMVLVVEKRDD